MIKKKLNKKMKILFNYFIKKSLELRLIILILFLISLINFLIFKNLLTIPAFLLSWIIGISLCYLQKKNNSEEN